MRFYISADIEGVAGISSREQLGPQGGADHARARETFTAEVAAACEALMAAGATGIVISDSHGNAQNLLIEKLPRGVELVRAWPRPLSMMQGIEEGPFEGAILLGYHAAAADTAGVCAHSFSGKSFVDVALNGTSIAEADFNAAIAGHFGVPVILATGDDVLAAHVRRTLDPDLPVVITKTAYGTHAARMRHPADVLADIHGAVAAAVAGRGARRPWRLEGPVTLDIIFTSRMPAELLAYLPQVERTGSHGIQFRGSDMVAVARFLHFVQAYPQAAQA